MYYPKSQNRKNVEENKALLNWKNMILPQSESWKIATTKTRIF